MPVGFVVTALVQGVIRLANSEIPFIAELTARCSEPWAFMLPAVWVIPQHKRVLIAISTCLFFGVAVLSFYMAVTSEQYSEQPWADISFSIVTLISSTICAYVCWKSE